MQNRTFILIGIGLVLLTVMVMNQRESHTQYSEFVKVTSTPAQAASTSGNAQMAVESLNATRLMQEGMNMYLKQDYTGASKAFEHFWKSNPDPDSIRQMMSFLNDMPDDNLPVLETKAAQANDVLDEVEVQMFVRKPSNSKAPFSDISREIEEMSQMLTLKLNEQMEFAVSETERLQNKLDIQTHKNLSIVGENEELRAQMARLQKSNIEELMLMKSKNGNLLQEISDVKSESWRLKQDNHTYKENLTKIKNDYSAILDKLNSIWTDILQDMNHRI